MTIQEVIKSGKPFRRKVWSDGKYVKKTSNITAYNVEEILAEDWEIYEEKYSFNSTELKLKILEILVCDVRGLGLYTDYDIGKVFPKGLSMNEVADRIVKGLTGKYHE